MLDEGARKTIFTLAQRGMSIRGIARTLRISRSTVRQVLGSGSPGVPRLKRIETLSPWLEPIRELYEAMKGNLVRVHEEITAEGVEISYQALTSFCRRHGIGVKEKVPAGRYHFAPGEEMQHDTSPHELLIGGVGRAVQVASLVLCYSRVIFFQYYPRFRRFEARIFLTDALRYVGGACRWCMIDNTSVVRLKGTGAEMVPVPEMEAFGEQYGFRFRAHELGDKNRSARVERPFHYIENNFEVGRSAKSLADWNAMAREWCDRVSGRRKRTIQARPWDLFETERPHLTPHPEFVPEACRHHTRLVDIEGYVSVDSNHYSVPVPVGKQVEVRETKDRIIVYDGHRIVADHPRVDGQVKQRVTDPAHRPERGSGQKRRAGQAAEMERKIVRLVPDLAGYVERIRVHGRGPLMRRFRKMIDLVRSYPREPVLSAFREAEAYGLYDLDRIERMILRRIGEDFFFLT